MKVTWFGHSAFAVQTGGAKILIDPFLSGNSTFESAGLNKDAVTLGATHVILTHGHDDHVGDTVEICKTEGASLTAVYELALYLNGKGVENIDPANPGGAINKKDFTVSFVNALHSSSTMVDGAPVYLGAACGVIIKAEGKSLYHMGDTDVMSNFKIINDLHKPDIGIVPIGDRFTMGAKSAAYACKTFFNFSTIIPCHYGTFPIIDQTADGFVSEMGADAVKVPKVGEPFEI